MGDYSEWRIRSMVSELTRQTNDDKRMAVRGARDGSLSVIPEIEMLAREGRIFAANVGTLSTPTTFRVAIDLDQPELVIDVKDGKTMIPLSIDIYLEAALGTLTEILAKTSQNLVGAGTSTALVAGSDLVNVRSDAVRESTLAGYYTYSGDGVDPAGGYEFWRDGDPFVVTVAASKHGYKWRREVGGPVIVGEGAFVLHIGATGTAPTGYALVTFAEFNTGWIV